MFVKKRKKKEDTTSSGHTYFLQLGQVATVDVFRARHHFGQASGDVLHHRRQVCRLQRLDVEPRML